MALTPRNNTILSRTGKPIVSSPLPKEKSMSDPKGSMIFYSTAPTLNLRDQFGKQIAFRNHYLRTSDKAMADFIKKECIDRSLPNAVVKQVTEKELQDLLTRPAEAITDPKEGVIEPLPSQEDPSKEETHKEEEKKDAGVTTGMINSQTVAPVTKS